MAGVYSALSPLSWPYQSTQKTEAFSISPHSLYRKRKTRRFALKTYRPRTGISPITRRVICKGKPTETGDGEPALKISSIQNPSPLREGKWQLSLSVVEEVGKPHPAHTRRFPSAIDSCMLKIQGISPVAGTRAWSPSKPTYPPPGFMRRQLLPANLSQFSKTIVKMSEEWGSKRIDNRYSTASPGRRRLIIRPQTSDPKGMRFSAQKPNDSFDELTAWD